MPGILPGAGHRPTLRASEQRLIGEFVEREFGIQMPPSKKALLEGRLSKRLAACRVSTFGEYFDFITKDPKGRDEFLRFTDLVSTHETSFFREDRHFEFLGREAVPEFASRSYDTLNVLCAACSSGEEAYTIAMVSARALGRAGRDALSLRVEGVDLSQRMVDIARRGVYTDERVARVPQDLKREWLMRGKDRRSPLWRFVPELRACMSFHTGNLLGDMGAQRGSYNVIFCRNVLIYFDRDNQARTLERLVSLLAPDGYLFLGHSESVSGTALPLRRVAMSVYRNHR